VLTGWESAAVPRSMSMLGGSLWAGSPEVVDGVLMVAVRVSGQTDQGW
jgi:hypothetical protein